MNNLIVQLNDIIESKRITTEQIDFLQQHDDIICDITMNSLCNTISEGVISQKVSSVIRKFVNNLTETKKDVKYSKIAGCDVTYVNEVFKGAVNNFPCVYLFTLGKVKDLRQSMQIDNSFNDESIVIKYGMSDNLVGRMNQHVKTYGKYGCKVSLKYYMIIDETYESSAENDVKKYFSSLNVLFSYDTHKELAILTIQQLIETKHKYIQLSELYSGRLTIAAIRNEKRNIKKDLEKEKQSRLYSEKIISITTEMNDIIRIYCDKLLQSEKEKNMLEKENSLLKYELMRYKQK